MVYQLYDLTEEEIRVVEGPPCLRRERDRQAHTGEDENTD